MGELMDIRFYYVDKDYIDYLKQYEISHRGFTCVPNVTYANRSKFVYGSVLEKAYHEYPAEEEKILSEIT